jgi:hypothetical protein
MIKRHAFVWVGCVRMMWRREGTWGVVQEDDWDDEDNWENDWDDGNNWDDEQEETGRRDGRVARSREEQRSIRGEESSIRGERGGERGG